MLVAFEGTDGVGKSAYLFGWDEAESNSHLYNHIDGLGARLSFKGHKVHLTKEPGTTGFTPISIENHLNTVDNFCFLAEQKIDVFPKKWQPLVKYCIQRIRLALNNSEDDWVWDIDRFTQYAPEGEEPPRTRVPRMDTIQRRTADFEYFLGTDPVLRHRICRYTFRDCCRHILLHCIDSPQLQPISVGLVFFINHLAHQIRLDRLRADFIFTDRYSFSQLTYGRVRDTHPVVEELYQRFGDTEPTTVVLFVCDPDELETRITGRTSPDEVAKQNSKSWNEADFRRDVQEEYLRMAKEDPNRWHIIDTTNKSREQVLTELLGLFS